MPENKDSMGSDFKKTPIMGISQDEIIIDFIGKPKLEYKPMQIAKLNFEKSWTLKEIRERFLEDFERLGLSEEPIFLAHGDINDNMLDDFCAEKEVVVEALMADAPEPNSNKRDQALEQLRVRYNEIQKLITDRGYPTSQRKARVVRRYRNQSNRDKNQNT